MCFSLLDEQAACHSRAAQKKTSLGLLLITTGLKVYSHQMSTTRAELPLLLICCLSCSLSFRGVAMVFAGIGFEVKGKYDRRRRDQAAEQDKKSKDRLIYLV